MARSPCSEQREPCSCGVLNVFDVEGVSGRLLWLYASALISPVDTTAVIIDRFRPARGRLAATTDCPDSGAKQQHTRIPRPTQRRRLEGSRSISSVRAGWKVIVRGRNDEGMDSDVVQLRTDTRLVTDITDLVLQFCGNRGAGLCHVFVPQATAGIALIETGSGSGSESELEDAIERLLPRDDIYRHRHVIASMMGRPSTVLDLVRQHPVGRFSEDMATDGC